MMREMRPPHLTTHRIHKGARVREASSGSTLVVGHINQRMNGTDYKDIRPDLIQHIRYIRSFLSAPPQTRLGRGRFGRVHVFTLP